MYIVQYNTLHCVQKQAKSAVHLHKS